MERREFMNLSTVALGALMMDPLLNSCKNITPHSTNEKPNIVFIIIDDLGWKDVGYMGSDYYETPNIDNLAQKGMIFSNAYANAANCAPTRASLLTGQYSPRHGVYTVASSARGESKNRRLIPIENSTEVDQAKITIAEALKNAGYLSAAIGKWHVGQKPEQHGFDFGIDRNELNIKGHFSENGEYLTDLLTDEAINFIKKNGYITNDYYIQINQISDRHARRDLSRMVELDIVARVGRGRSTRYVLK